MNSIRSVSLGEPCELKARPGWPAVLLQWSGRPVGVKRCSWPGGPKSRPTGVRASVVALRRVTTVERRGAVKWVRKALERRPQTDANGGNASISRHRPISSRNPCSSSPIAPVEHCPALPSPKMSCFENYATPGARGLASGLLTRNPIPVQSESDPEKSASNRAKHGFDFADAAALWADVDAISLPASSQTEIRCALVARHGGALLYPAWVGRADHQRPPYPRQRKIPS